MLFGKAGTLLKAHSVAGAAALGSSIAKAARLRPPSLGIIGAFDERYALRSGVIADDLQPMPILGLGMDVGVVVVDGGSPSFFDEQLERLDRARTAASVQQQSSPVPRHRCPLPMSALSSVLDHSKIVCPNARASRQR